jgi:hypothetical protein
VAFFSRAGTQSTLKRYRGTNQQLSLAMTTENPKVDPPPLSNTEKDPEDWVSGDEPMTGAQASYLKTLTEQLGQQDEFSQSLTKAEASKRIDALKGELGRRRAAGPAR